MNKDDIKVYKEIQKNTQMAMKAIDEISDKIYEDDLSMHVARQSVKYSQLHDKAKERLLNEKAETYQKSAMKDAMLTMAIQCNTLFDSSTSHVAELLIQGSNRGITDMCKILNHSPNKDRESVELAKELMDFEEKNIERLRNYL